MIRFAPQPAKPADAPLARTRSTAPSADTASANAVPLAGLLLPDLDPAENAPARTVKPRGAKKQKAAADIAAVQLDLDA